MSATLSAQVDESQYSWLRRYLWPIYGKEENTKFLLLLLMLILSLFNYTCLRINKDDFILGAPFAGKDTLSFLKLYCVLPFTFIFIGVFWWASNKLSKEKLFFATLVPFFLFFSIFTFILMPYSSYLHARPEVIESWINAYPFLTQAFPIFGYWTYTLFYMVAELWGNVVITFLFWGFVNEVVRKDQTVRFFSVFASYGNFGLILAGNFISFVEARASKFAPHSAERLAQTSWVFYVLLFCIFLLALTYWYINHQVLPYETIGNISTSMKKKPKASATLSESFKIITSSRYLLCILVLVLAYGITSNLVEVSWKGAAKELYKDGYKAYMAQFFKNTGYCVCIFGFLTKSWIGRFGWLFSAVLTPIMMLLTSVMFFVYIIFGNILPVWMFFGHDPLWMSVLIGAIQNIGSKAAKYTLFDPTTQMAYLPLDEDTRLKGKAAVDVLGGRAGKCGGAAIQSTLSMIYGKAATKIVTTAPILFGLSLVLCVSWIYATIGLASQYYFLLNKREEEEKAERQKEESLNKEEKSLSSSFDEINEGDLNGK